MISEIKENIVMKLVFLIITLFVVLALMLPSQTSAQATYPIINSATTIVGEGGLPDEEDDPTEEGENPSLPPVPTMEEFLRYFQIFTCTNSSLASTSDCRVADRFARETGFVYGKYADPMRTQRYRQLLNVDRYGKVKVYIKPANNPNDDICDFSGGADYGSDDIRLSGYTQPQCDPDDIKWSMIHESAHIIQTRSAPLYNAFRVEVLARADGEDCYDEGLDGPYIQTYRYRGSRSISDFRCLAFNGQLCDGGGAKAESFGEAVGMNVVCGPNKTCQKAFIPIRDYPAKCKNTYDWVKQNVYGGIDFFAPGTGGNSEVVRWATRITSSLQRSGGSECLYNRQPYDNICSRGRCATKLAGQCNGTMLPAYLCTQLIKDSYNLAGKVNSFSLNTYYMEQAWSQRNGYKVLSANNQTTIRQLKAGDVIFMFDTYSPTGLKHVVVIRNIQVDSNGNGKINILQSNSHSVSSYYPINRWKIIHYYRNNPNAILKFGLGPRNG